MATIRETIGGKTKYYFPSKSLNKPIGGDPMVNCKHETKVTGKKNWTWLEYDAQGICLGKVCHECVKEFLGQFRPCILSGYDQSDVDEPIEPEEPIGGLSIW